MMIKPPPRPVSAPKIPAANENKNNNEENNKMDKSDPKTCVELNDLSSL